MVESAHRRLPPGPDDLAGPVPPYAHSVNPSRWYSVLKLGRAFIRAASAPSAGHSCAGLGMLRDQRISIVA